MLSARLLGGKARAREEHRRVVHVDGSELAGRGPLELAAEGRAVVAVQRNGAVVSKLDGAFRIDRDDAVWVCAV